MLICTSGHASRTREICWFWDSRTWIVSWRAWCTHSSCSKCHTCLSAWLPNSIRESRFACVTLGWHGPPISGRYSLHQFVQVKKFQHSSKATDGASSNNTKQTRHKHSLTLYLCLAKASPSFDGDESVKGARALEMFILALNIICLVFHYFFEIQKDTPLFLTQ